MKKACPSCKIAAATLLDYPNLVCWSKAFVKAAGHQPKYWAMHNYVSANRFDASRTVQLLRAVKGEIWLTEVGGLVKRRTPDRKGKAKLKEGVAPRRQGDELHLRPASPASARASAASTSTTGTASGPLQQLGLGLFDHHGKARPAFTVLQRCVGSRAAARPSPAARASRRPARPRASARRWRRVSAMAEALVIVDFQNDFTPGGALAVPHGDEIAGRIAELLDSGRFDLVVATRDWHPADHGSFIGRPPGIWPPHCVQGTPGAELHAGAGPRPRRRRRRQGAGPADRGLLGLPADRARAGAARRRRRPRHGRRPGDGLLRAPHRARRAAGGLRRQVDRAGRARASTPSRGTPSGRSPRCRQAGGSVV